MLANTDNTVSGATWKRMPSRENARSFISIVNERKQQSRDDVWQQQQNERMNNSVSLSAHWVSATDEWIKKDYDKASRMESAAWMVSAFNGTTGNFQDVISNFINEHDWADRDMYNAFFDYIQNWSIDENELASRTIDKVDENLLLSNDFVYDPFKYNSVQYEDSYTYNPFENIPNTESAQEEGKEEEKEKQDDASWLENVIWGIVETALWIPKLAVKWGAYVGYGRDKLLWEDETVAKANLNKTLNWIDETFEKLTPWDEDSLLRNGVNLATDLWVTALATMLPWVWEAKWAEFLTKYPKLASVMKSFWTFEEFATKYPKWANAIKTFLKWGKLWAEIEVINNALDWEFTDGWELLQGGLFGYLTELGLNTKAAKSISTRLQTDWLMTTARMRNIVNKIKDVTTNATPERLAKFMTKYWLTWSREVIKKRAEQLYKSTMEIVDWVFSKVKWEFESSATSDAIQTLLKKFGSEIKSWKATKSGYEETISFLKDVYNSANKYTAEAMEGVKRLVDKEIHAFKNSWEMAGGYSSWVSTRGQIQKQLEEIWSKYWDIEMLNNIVQTAYWVMEWVWSKMAWDNFMNIATKAIPVALWIPAIKDVVKWNWASVPADLILPIVSSNTWLKTHAWSLLNRMRWTTRDQVNKFITSEWKTALSEEATEEFMKVLKWDEWFKTRFKDFIANYIKDSLIIWETNIWEGVSKLADSVLWDIQTE